ncbi:hypothetical protein V9T40_010880 [Parthenolecanium corni]|uniref:BTB domain-containing protein n=1 Tax=Parthenolecanium corni TaxID=536013 RepID=A0AAN9XY14_9HEMI
MNLDYSTLHFNSVISHFSDQFRNEEFLDCTLNAEGKSIRVHRAVLCAQSTLLEKMILEHIHVSDLFVTLDGVPFEDLKSVVQFMYDGWAKLSQANFDSFLVVAQLLGMKWVDYVQVNVEEVNDSGANEPSEPLQNITNTDLPQRKRKKCMKTKRHSKKLKCTRAERRLALRSPQVVVEATSHETDLAKMDEDTFCTALGLKKITDEDVLPKLKLVSRTKRMPSLIKINCEEDKENCEPQEHSVFIEEKSLSFLNANANEMRIRENNIEIECDVLEASSQYVVYDKGNAEEIVELPEGKGLII